MLVGGSYYLRGSDLYFDPSAPALVARNVISAAGSIRWDSTNTPGRVVEYIAGSC